MRYGYTSEPKKQRIGKIRDQTARNSILPRNLVRYYRRFLQFYSEAGIKHSSMLKEYQETARRERDACRCSNTLSTTNTTYPNIHL